MIRSMITSMVNPDAGGAEQRVFIKFDSTQMNYLEITTPIVMSSNFTAGSKAVLSTSATNYTILGQTASPLNYFKILSTGFASINIDGSVVTSTVAATKDNIFRRYDVELDGNDFKFLEGGLVIDTVTDAVAAAKTFTINAIAVSNGADFFDSTLADASFDDNGTPTDFRIDQLTGNSENSVQNNNTATYILVPVGAPDRETFTLTDDGWVGQELVVNGGFTTDSDWTKGTGWTIGGGVASYDGLNGTQAISADTGSAVAGDVHKINFDVVANDAGGNNSTFYGSVQLTGSHLPVDSYEFTSTATGTGSFSTFGRASNEYSIDNVSVKRILEVAP